MTRTKKKAPGGGKTLIPCTVCDKKFGLESKLQRHLLLNHVEGVTVELPDRESVSDGQWRAHQGVQKALGVANGAVANTSDPEGVVCPQCLPDASEKKWKSPLSLATHIMSKHCDELSDMDSEENPDAQSNLAGEPEESERVSTTKKRPACEVESPVDDVAKRTKLLCVDMTQKGALVPPSDSLPNPPDAIKQAAKAEPDLLDANGKCDASVKRPAEEEEPGDPGLAKKRKLSTPEGLEGSSKLTSPEQSVAGRPDNPGDPTTPAASQSESSGQGAFETASKVKVSFPRTVTANRPPLTPKASGTKSLAKVGAKPNDSVVSPAGASKSNVDAVALAAAAAASVIATDPAKQPLVSEASPLGGLSKTIVSRGFDMDSGDICDFPSSVERAYYRSSRKVETGGGSSRR